jgi:hypothetical protein
VTFEKLSQNVAKPISHKNEFATVPVEKSNPFRIPLEVNDRPIGKKIWDRFLKFFRQNF